MDVLKNAGWMMVFIACAGLFVWLMSKAGELLTRWTGRHGFAEYGGLVGVILVFAAAVYVGKGGERSYVDDDDWYWPDRSGR